MIYAFNANEVFKIAIEVEKNGYQFYQKAQGVIGDPEVEGIFAGLAQEEIEHEKRFAELQSSLPKSAKESTVWDPDNETDQYLRMMAGMHVFRSDKEVDKALAGIKDAKDALKVAMQFEKDSIAFFMAMKDATEEKQGRDLIGLLVDEERGHLRKLSVALSKLL